MTRKMKDSGIEWIGEIPVDWEVVPTKRFYKNEKEIVGERESQFERLALTLNGVIKRSKDDGKGLQPEKFETYQVLYKDELIFKLIDLENVRTSRVGYSNYTGIVSPVYVRLINPDESKFGYYYFINMWHQQIFNYLGSGVRSNLTANELLKVPYLDIKELEKKNIIKKLDIKTKGIKLLLEQTRQSIEELKKYKQSLITEAVTKGLDLNVEMKDSGIEWIGKIPKHWNYNKIARVTESYSGGTPSRNVKEYWENGTIPWVSSGEVNKKIIFNTKEKITKKGLDNSAAKLFPTNTVLVALNGQGKTKGMSAILKIEASTNQSLVGFICKEELLDYKYLNFLFISSYRYNRSYYAGGDKREGIAAGDLRQKIIPLPPLEEQQEIVSYLDEQTSLIDKLIEDKTKVIEELEDYKKSLIYEYVTGKKEV